MKFADITPAKFYGEISVVPSKSFSHRAAICAALSEKRCNIFSMSVSDDVLATVRGLKKIGANIFIDGDTLIAKEKGTFLDGTIIDCNDSGTTLRFLIPLIAALGKSAIFKRGDSLLKRPIKLYLEILKKFGVKYNIDSNNLIYISGQLKSGVFFIPGNISSQFVSGLLMALPLIDGSSEVNIVGVLESEGYVDMTIEMMKQFGVNIFKEKNKFYIKGGQKYQGANLKIEGDWSQAAFFMVGAAISGEIVLKNLNKNSCQGDKRIEKLISDFGASVHWDNNKLIVKKSFLHGVHVDASQIPDLVPALAVLGANSYGQTKIFNAKRLKFKECDRLQIMYEQLKKLNVNITKSKDSLTIFGKKNICSTSDLGYNDHRIVMALAIMALNLKENSLITYAQSVNKSYPEFFKHYNMLGGNARVFDVGE